MYFMTEHNKLCRAVVIQILAILLVALPAFFLLSSCRPDQVFGELLICSSIDSPTSVPAGTGNEYCIDSEQIVACINIAGIRGSSRWRFVWENIDTGEIIAESSGNYSNNPPGFAEGYLTNKLLRAEGAEIIAGPGNYRVSFYHDGGLLKTADFIIKRPDINILEFNFYSGIDGNGKPLGPVKGFSQNDKIYAAIKLNYKIEGDRYLIEWFNDGRLLGEEEYVIKESSYVPYYIIFHLTNKEQEPFPAGSYNARISGPGQVSGEYFFEVSPITFTQEIFAGSNSYRDDIYKFSIIYPDGWSIDKNDIEPGIRIRFAPVDGIRQIVINMWVLKEGYYPEAEDFSSFADKLLAEQMGEQAEGGMDKTQTEKAVGDIKVYEVKYDKIENGKSGWQITFSFIKKNGLLFLLMRFTDHFYIDYAEKVTDYMIDSIKIIE